MIRIKLNKSDEPINYDSSSEEKKKDIALLKKTFTPKRSEGGDEIEVIN